MRSASKRLLILSLLFGAILLASCASHQEAADDEQSAAELAAPAAAVKAKMDNGGALPVQFQYPSYVVGQEDDAAAIAAEKEPALKVGAKIETREPQPLWIIMKSLADLKRMNISWASDVNQNAPVYANISANDDFYESLSNLLRQLDYYYEVKGNTIIVKYKETRSFQIAMPFIKTQYSTGVGGNMLGNDENSRNMDGSIQLKSDQNQFDIWDNIQKNLNSLLGIWAIDPKNKVKSEADLGLSDATLLEKCREDNPDNQAAQKRCWQEQKKSRAEMTALMAEANQSQAVTTANSESASGKSDTGNSYIIDKPVGIITVSAPRPLLEKIDEYFTTLKKSLYRQVAIEAKIIEVQLNNSSSIGINWNKVLNNFQAITGSLGFGYGGLVYPYISAASGQGNRVNINLGQSWNSTQGGQASAGIYGPNADGSVNTSLPGATILSSVPLQDPGRFISTVALAPANFEAMINALKTEGNAKVLSSPKLSVMNGQPAMISVGTNYTYIKKMDVTVDNSGGSSQRNYTVDTGRVLSGLGMSLTATILGDNEIILNLVPVTSELVKSATSAANPDEPVYSKSFGAEGQSVGLPIINVREMNTTVKIRDGEMLAIGGLISETERNEGNFVPILGSIPLIKYLFGYETKQKQKNELIILLKPKII